MRDPNITQRILAAIDRSEDPHLHIDILRREVYEQSLEMKAMAQDIKLLQDAERERLTKTGVWTIVKAKLDQQTIDWTKWAIRAALGGIGAGMLAIVGHLAWRGLKS